MFFFGFFNYLTSSIRFFLVKWQFYVLMWTLEVQQPFINLAWVTAVSFAFSFILLVRTVVIVCSGKEKTYIIILIPLLKFSRKIPK